MKRQTTVSVGLLVAVAVLFLASVTAKPSEQPESSVSQPSPSSQSPRESEGRPEQRFIELSRTKKPSNLRRRPPSRRFRTSTTPPPEIQTQPSAPLTESSLQTQSPTNGAAPADTSTTTTSQSPVTTFESTPTPPTEESPNIANKVRFTKTRAAKSERGQVFTFTFKHRNNSVKEKQHTQSRIPARVSPATSTQTPQRHGSVPKSLSETNQPDNAAINSGPPGDIPRARQPGRALNLPVATSQRNQISQSQDVEAKTVPENIGESSSPDKFLPSFKPKSKARPFNGRLNSLPDVAGTPGASTQPVQESYPVNEEQNLARDSSSIPKIPKRPLQDGFLRKYPNDSGVIDDLPTPSPRETDNQNLQTRNFNEGQNIPNLPATLPPRVRYVKAGSLRSFPKGLDIFKDTPPELVRNSARPTLQTINEGQGPSELDNYPPPRRPDPQSRPVRPESVRFLQESPASSKDVPPEETRNNVEPTSQTSTLSEEQVQQEPHFLHARQKPNQLQKQESLRFVPTEPQEIPPELARDFVNLQTLTGNRDPARYSLQEQQRFNLPRNLEPVRFLSEAPIPPQELSSSNFTGSTSRPLKVNEGQYQLPPGFLKQSDRPTKVNSQEIARNNEENLDGLLRETLRDVSRPTVQSLIEKPEQDLRQGRLQELPQTSQPLKERFAIFVPIGTQGLPPQLSRDLAEQNSESLVTNERQEPIRQEVLRNNRFLEAGAPRFVPKDPRRFPPQLIDDYGHDYYVQQESPRLNQPYEGSSRFLPNDPQRPPPQTTREFLDPNLQTLIENEERNPRRQEYLQDNRPSKAEASRFLPNNPQGLPTKSINFADPNVQNVIENGRQNLASFSSPAPQSLYRPQLESVRLLTNQAFAGEQSSSARDNTDFNFRNVPLNERPVNERLPARTPDTPVLSQNVHSEPAVNSFTNSIKRPSSILPNTRGTLDRLDANQKAVTDNTEPTHPKPNIAKPTEPPSPPTTVQTNPQTAIPSPSYSINPPTNIPRLIIEFPSSPTSGDQSIRLQLNPNAVPTATAASPHPSTPRISTDITSSSATADTSNNQPKQQDVPASGGAVIDSRSVPQLPAQTSSPPITASMNPSVREQTGQQTSPPNSGLSTNSQVHAQQLSSRPLALPTTSDDSTSFQLNQQILKNTEIAVNRQPNIPNESTADISSPPKADSVLREQPKSPFFQANTSSKTLEISAHPPPALPQIASTNLQPNSQTLPSHSILPINPLSKMLAFPSQPLPSQSSTLLNTSNRLQENPQIPSSNLAKTLNSVSNTRPVEQLTLVTHDSSIHSPPNSQITTNVGSPVNTLSTKPVIPSEIQATPSLVSSESDTRLKHISHMTDTKPAVNSSLNSEGRTAESNPPVTDGPSKSIVQVPPVDVHLTINFNSNIPGFIQPPSNPTQVVGSNAGSSNNTQLNATTSPQGQPSPILPNTSNSPTRSEFNQQIQPINSLSTTEGLPVDLLPPINSSPLRLQSDFQASENFRPPFNPQFDIHGLSPITRYSSTHTPPISQFLNANNVQPVNTQFDTFRNQLNLQSLQSRPIQDQLSRFNQNSQFLPTNAAPPTNSQFGIPGRPFEVQTQQPPIQAVLARYKPQSQFQTINARYVNSQFNNFDAFPSQSSPLALTQVSPTRLRPVPQVFTENTGLAVNSLSFSHGLPIELLPPLTDDSPTNSKRSEVSTTNEQPRVSFLVNSPELSAELLPPVVSQSSVSAQPSNFQPVQPTSPQPPVTRFSSAEFDPSAQLAPVNIGRVPQPPIELLPPLDAFFPRFSQNPNEGLPPNPIDIPKPDVPALVPPPREKITPIDIPRPAVPALVPPPREHVGTPIDIPKPDVPALVPPPREHIETPIDIPKPDVPALVPPPRPSDLARLLPPTPTSFTFNPPDVSQSENVPNPDSRPFNSSIQANLQSPQIIQTSSDNPVLILPKSSSRQQGRSNSPLSVEELSKRIGFLPENLPAPFSRPAQFPTDQTKSDSVFQISDIRAGQLQPIAQVVATSDTRSQLATKANPASPQTALLRTPVSLGLQAPFFPTSGSSLLELDSILSNKQTKTSVDQSSIDQRLKATIQTPTQTLLPPVEQGFTLPTTDNPKAIPSSTPLSQTTPAFGTTTSLTSLADPPTVNIVPPKPKIESPVDQTSLTSQTQQTLPQPPQEGFVIFQTPTITVTSQTNRPDSQINVTVVTQGGTGHIKPNTTLTAEPLRPMNITLSPESHLFVSTPPAQGSLNLPDLPSTLLPPLNERTSSPPVNTLLHSLNSGFVRNNVSLNPFVPPFSQPFPSQSNPFRFSNITLGTAPGTNTACPKLDLKHKGHRAPQFSGHLILSPGFYPIDDPTPTRCDDKTGIDGKKFNWWQILLNNGGEPSTLSRLNESEDAKLPPLTNPCVRPFETEGVPVFYNTTKTDSRTYYREEVAYHRFPESKNTFLESRGLFVWAQAKTSFDPTAYLVLYTRDDSGFWLQVKNVNCQFDKNSQPNLQCRSVPECFCDGGEKRCTESVPVLTRNFPVKTFRF